MLSTTIHHAVRSALATLAVLATSAMGATAQAQAPGPEGAVRPSGVLKATYQTTLGTIENVGTGFLLDAPGHGTVFVTALHVFGPPGGIQRWVPSEELPAVVESATLTDAFTQEPAGRVVEVISTPGASLPHEDGGEPGRDFAVFRTAGTSARGLTAGRTGAAPGDDRLWIVSPGLPKGGRYPVARVPGPEHFVTVAIPQELTLPVGISGSPLVSAGGEVVGLVVTLERGDGAERVIHGTPIHTVMRALAESGS